MTEGPLNSFVHGHGDVPDGENLQGWKRRQVAPQRRAQVTGGVIAALTTLAPIVLSVRGARAR